MTLWHPAYGVEDPLEERTSSRSHSKFGPEPSKNPCSGHAQQTCVSMVLGLLIILIRSMPLANVIELRRASPWASEHRVSNPLGWMPSLCRFHQKPQAWPSPHLCQPWGKTRLGNRSHLFEVFIVVPIFRMRKLTQVNVLHLGRDRLWMLHRMD